MPLLLSTADTDLLAARAASAADPAVNYRVANPARVDPRDLPALLDGVRVAVVRLLGGARVWEDGLAALARAGVPTVALGGEATPDADLMALSSVPLGIAAVISFHRGETDAARRHLAAAGPHAERLGHRAGRSAGSACWPGASRRAARGACTPGPAKPSGTRPGMMD